MNEAYERTRNDHKSIGLSADHALAWHELGHGLAARRLGRLIKIELLPDNAALGGLAGHRRNGISLQEEYWIAAMGPAAQRFYTERLSTPSSGFVEHYVMGRPMLGDLRKLRSSWPTANIGEESFRASIQMLAYRMRPDDETLTWLHETCESLVAKRTILASELPPPPHGLTMLLDGLRETLQQ